MTNIFIARHGDGWDGRNRNLNAPRPDTSPRGCHGHRISAIGIGVDLAKCGPGAPCIGRKIARHRYTQDAVASVGQYLDAGAERPPAYDINAGAGGTTIGARDSEGVSAHCVDNNVPRRFPSRPLVLSQTKWATQGRGIPRADTGIAPDARVGRGRYIDKKIAADRTAVRGGGCYRVSPRCAHANAGPNTPLRPVIVCKSRCGDQCARSPAAQLRRAIDGYGRYKRYGYHLACATGTTKGIRRRYGVSTINSGI